MVVGLSKCKGSVTEIAQRELSDLTFNLQYCCFTCSSVSVKKLWDTGKAILTSVNICPISSPLSSISIPNSALKPQDAKISQRLGTMSLEYRTIVVDNSDNDAIRSASRFYPWKFRQNGLIIQKEK